MPVSDAEIEAAARAVCRECSGPPIEDCDVECQEAGCVSRQLAKAALTAAERVREKGE